MLGLDCSTCGATSHPDCVREFGGCHEAELQDLPEDLSPAARRRRADAAHRDLELARLDGEAGPPLRRAEKRVLGLGAVGLLAATICAGLNSPALALTTLMMGLLGSFTFWQVWRGFSTGLVRTTFNNSSAQYSRQDQPAAFMFHAITWTGLGMVCAVVAAIPFFLTP